MSNTYMHVLYFLLLCIALGNVQCETEQEYAPVVETSEGAVRGKILQSYKGRTIYAYLGIPYAAPPVGNNRFKTPKQLATWDGVRDAIREGSHCPQLSYPEQKYEGSEDCLYLNVFTSKLPNGTDLQDVIVLIHDGGFTHGGGEIRDYGPDHLLDKDVVLVTFNYRIGALGFLATGDETAPGNYGLKDQVDALRWVRRNIIEFAGNPHSVTLMGSQAGGVSVHLHMLAPLSRRLFHRAISLSGTALSAWATVNATQARERAFKLGKLLNCEEQESETLTSCLTRKSAKEIVTQSIKILDSMTDLKFPFVPVVNEVVPQNSKAFILDHPEVVMSKFDTFKIEQYWGIPWLVGVTSHEGFPQASEVLAHPSLMDGFNSEPKEYLESFMGLKVTKQIAMQIWEFYFKNETLHYGTLPNLAQLIADYNQHYGLVRSVRLLANVSIAPIFVYHFSYDRRDPRTSLGVPQGDDMRYLFPYVLHGSKIIVGEPHYHMVQRLVHLIFNFAKYGDPTPFEEEELDNLLWPLAEAEDLHFVDLGASPSVVTDGFFPEHMAFWDTIHEQMSSLAVPVTSKDEQMSSTPTPVTSKDEL